MSVMTFDQVDTMLAMWQRTPSLAEMKPEDTEKIRDGVITRLQKSVVLRQYVRHLGRRDILPRNRFGWHAEGERLYAALLLATAGTEGCATLMTGAGDPLDATMSVGLAMHAMLAQVYLWSDEIESLADAAPLPPHIISRDILPFPIMFWSRETAHADADWETNWILITHSVPGIRIVVDVMRKNGDASIVVGDIPYGAKYPDDFEGQPLGPGPLLARLSFLASPYISAETERLPRAWRRAETKKGLSAASADPTIRIVKLRAEAQDAVRRQREDDGKPTERHSSWWVRGHHRAQWYPSKEAHEVIWIAPYLKGDLSQPLVRKVYGVVR